jgi:hypothetical protein
MHVQAIIIPPSGMSVSSSEFVESGAGQYTATFDIEPGKGRDIEVKIAANQVGNFNVSGRVVYYFGENMKDGEDNTLDLPIEVADPYTKPTPEQTPDLKSRLLDMPGIVVAGLLVVLILVLILRKK